MWFVNSLWPAFKCGDCEESEHGFLDVIKAQVVTLPLSRVNRRCVFNIHYIFSSTKTRIHQLAFHTRKWLPFWGCDHYKLLSCCNMLDTGRNHIPKIKSYTDILKSVYQALGYRLLFWPNKHSFVPSQTSKLFDDSRR